MFKQLRALPLAVVQRPGSKVCRKLGNKRRIQDFYAKKELQGVCNGPSCLGKKNPRFCPGLEQLSPKHLLSHCQAAVFSPYLMFYYTSWKGLQGHLGESWSSHRLAQCLFWRCRSTHRTKAVVLGWVCLCFPRLFLFLLSEPPQTGGSLVTVMLCL